MNIQITFKLIPTPGELDFPAQYEEFRRVIELAHGNSAFGKPETVQLRWMINSAPIQAGA